MPPRMQIQHFLGDFEDCLLDAALLVLPLLTAQSIQGRDAAPSAPT